MRSAADAYITCDNNMYLFLYEYMSYITFAQVGSMQPGKRERRNSVVVVDKTLVFALSFDEAKTLIAAQVQC